MPAFSVTPKSLQAGSHPDVTIHAEFSGSEHVRDLTISLPPGLAGDPTSKPRCAQSAFQADNCPAATRVGTTSVRTVIPPLAILPITASGDVYNVVPAAGEPARLGVVVRPPGASKVFIASPVRIRPADGGLDSVITNMPSTVSVAGLPVEMFIQAMDLTLSAPFASLPTACKPAQARVAAVSAAGTAVSRAADAVHADRLRQGPVRAAAGGVGRLDATCPACARSSPSRAATPRPRPPRSRSRATIAINVAALNDVCTTDEQAAGPCPARARVGSAVARTPLLAQPLTGPVALAAIPGQPLPGLRMELSGAAALTLAGAVDISPIRATFAGIPDVPLERFELTFDAGPDAGLPRRPLPRPRAARARRADRPQRRHGPARRAARRDRLRAARRHADRQAQAAEAAGRGAARPPAGARAAQAPAPRAAQARLGRARRRPAGCAACAAAR